MGDTIFCSNCGKENNKNNYKCYSCDSLLTLNESEYNKTINSFDELFTEENMLLIENTVLDDDIYNIIIESIIDKCKTSMFIPENSSCLEKIISIANTCVTCKYKSIGSDTGYYIPNMIFLDDRASESSQIATVIHELAHHLYSKIFSLILMYILDVKENPIIESFTWYCISSDILAIMSSEFASHTSENRFSPYGYQSYTSVVDLIRKNEELNSEDQVTEEDFHAAMVFGKNMSQDIIKILEEFIDKNIREEIKTQFKIDGLKPDYAEVYLEDIEESNEDYKYYAIKYFLVNSFEKGSNINNRNKLESIKKVFEEN